MNLKLVTWDGDLTQFLVEAETDDEAVRKAIEANLNLGPMYGEPVDDMEDTATYTVDDVDFHLLSEMFNRNDCNGLFAETVVFNY